VQQLVHTLIMGLMFACRWPEKPVLLPMQTTFRCRMIMQALKLPCSGQFTCLSGIIKLGVSLLK
jgi:hypothetical protein